MHHLFGFKYDGWEEFLWLRESIFKIQLFVTVLREKGSVYQLRIN